MKVDTGLHHRLSQGDAEGSTALGLSCTSTVQDKLWHRSKDKWLSQEVKDSNRVAVECVNNGNSGNTVVHRDWIYNESPAEGLGINKCPRCLFVHL